MSRDLGTCSICEESFELDWESYLYCNKCGTCFCESCIGVYNLKELNKDNDGLDLGEIDPKTCPVCNCKVLVAGELLDYLLDKVNMTKHHASNELLNYKKKTKGL